MEKYKQYTTQELWHEFNTISYWDTAEVDEFICNVKAINEELANEMLKQYDEWRKSK